MYFLKLAAVVFPALLGWASLGFAYAGPKAPPEFDVTSYEATPNDSSDDDRTAINKAIAEAQAFTAADADEGRGAVIVFPRGVYHMTASGGIPLQITGKRITVRAEGATLTKKANGSENQLLYISDTAEDVVVDGLTVDAQYPTLTTTGEGIGINVGGLRCSLRNCVVKNTQGSAIVDQIGAEFSDFRHCKTFDTGRHGIRSRGNNCHIVDCYLENWSENLSGGSTGGPAILADSKECDADEIHIERVTCRMTEARPTCEAILIDCGDGDLSDATDDFSVLGNSGAATEAFVSTGGWIHDAAPAGKAAWTVDAGHGYLPGDSINISESSIDAYNPVTSSLWMCHKIAAVTGRVFCRAESATTLTLHWSAQGAQDDDTPIDLTTAGDGLWYVKAVGGPRREIDSATGVDVDTDVITTDAPHGYRTGAEVRLTLENKTTSELPSPLVGGALITTTTPFAGAGTGAKYRLPKRYRKATLREVDIDFLTSTTTTDAAIKFIGVQDGLLDRVTVNTAGDLTSPAIDDASLQFGSSTRSLTLRDCWFGGGLRNNNCGWIGNLVIDRCHIGMDTPQTSGIEALQCGRFVLRDSTVRFKNYGITTGGSVSDAKQFRDRDCEEWKMENVVFECSGTEGTTRGLVIRCINAAHLRHSGIVKVSGIERRHVHTPVDGDGDGYRGLAYTNASGSTYTISGHWLGTGDMVYLYNVGGALPTGNAVQTEYFVRELSRSTVSLHPTIADAFANTNAVSTSDAGSGTHYMVSQKLGVGWTNDNNRDVMFRQRGSDGREFIASEAPANATMAYRAGDVIWKPDPVSGNFSPGWICTASGDTLNATAPTWTEMPDIDAD